MTRPPAVPRVTSIRFQVSMILLVSAFNAIVLVCVAIAAFSTLQDGPDGMDGDSIRAAIAEISELDHALRSESSMADLETSEVRIKLRLERMGAGGTDAREAWAAYVRLARTIDPPGTEAQQEDQTEALHRVLGALHVKRPQTIAERLGPGALVALLLWVVGVAVVTVVFSFRVRRLLSVPMAELTAAAERVARGELDSAIPLLGRTREILALRSALESMRRNLVDSIRELDTQNQIVGTMLAALEDGVLLLDPAGCVVEYNPSAVAVLEGLDGTQRPVEDGAPVAEVLPGAAFDQGSRGEERVLLTKKGEQRHLQLTHQALGHGAAGDRGAVLIIRDVTKARQLESLQRDFLSVVTHELKTPLTAIEGYVRLLLMGKGGDLTDKQRLLLEHTRDQSAVLGAMVQDLLDTTRLEGGNLHLELAPVDVAGVCLEVLSSMMGEAVKRGVELHQDLEVGGGLRIEGDSFRLQQVLNNLVRNALKFTPEGGRVTVFARQDGDSIELGVRDTGRGIPAEAIPHLFKKFYQVERGDTRRSGGAGLGLFICRRLALAMNGTIGVESTVGQGSRFAVRFPKLDPEAG